MNRTVLVSREHIRVIPNADCQVLSVLASRRVTSSLGAARIPDHDHSKNMASLGTFAVDCTNNC